MRNVRFIIPAISRWASPLPAVRDRQSASNRTRHDIRMLSKHGGPVRTSLGFTLLCPVVVRLRQKLATPFGYAFERLLNKPSVLDELEPRTSFKSGGEPSSSACKRCEADGDGLLGVIRSCSRSGCYVFASYSKVLIREVALSL